MPKNGKDLLSLNPKNPKLACCNSRDSPYKGIQTKEIEKTTKKLHFNGEEWTPKKVDLFSPQNVLISHLHTKDVEESARARATQQCAVRSNFKNSF
jgi:hypothetical protein